MAKQADAVKKTTPEERDDASAGVFAKDFLVSVDDSSKVADEIHERNKNAVILEAEQRGLRKNGEVKLVSSEPQDEHNTLLSYTLAVVSATETHTDKK